MTMKKFCWRLIGPGHVAENFAQALTVIEDAELYAVASRNKQRAISFADKYSAKTTYRAIF